MKMTKMKVTLFTVIAVILLAGATTRASFGDRSALEDVTGGTYLDFAANSETRDGITISGVILGDAVKYPAGSGTYVNWSVGDTSDSNRGTINGNCIEDNRKRTSSEPYIGADFNPFYVTLSGLTAGGTYGLKVVAMGVYEDPGNYPYGVLSAAHPDWGIGAHDFSYGAGIGSMTTVNNVATGTELGFSEISGPHDAGEYYYWKGTFACDIGQWNADGNGEIALYLGQGNVHLFDNGARTMLDGVVVVPEPVTFTLLSLGGLVLLRKRK